MRLLTALLAATLLIASAAADDDDDDEDPFAEPVRKGTLVTLVAPPAVKPGEAFTVKAVFVIPRGFHIYGPVAKGVQNPTPTIVVPQKAKGITWGKPVYPKVHKGPFVDKILEMTLSKYFKRVEVTIPATLAKDARYGALSLSIKAAWGTCNETSCRELFTIDKKPQVRTAKTRVVLSKPSLTVGALERGKPFTLTVTFDVPAGHHIYGPDAKDASPTVVTPTQVAGITWGKVNFPKGKTLSGKVVVTVSGTVAADAPKGPITLPALLSWSTCDAKSCYEFADKAPFEVAATVK